MAIKKRRQQKKLTKIEQASKNLEHAKRMLKSTLLKSRRAVLLAVKWEQKIARQENRLAELKTARSTRVRRIILEESGG